MSYLLDTGVWMWALDCSERLNLMALEILRDAGKEIFLSAVTTWEVSIKMSLHKLRFPVPPANVIPKFMAEQKLSPLAVTHEHAARVYDLPRHHRDPFDRMLIAQALVEELTILTIDREFIKYDVPILWCAR